MRRHALSLIAVLAAGTALADERAPAEVTLHARGDGWALADARGMTLYTFNEDFEPGKSACGEDCAAEWPPLAAPADARAFGDWTAIARDDGTHQWAYRGQPLYGYSGDVAAGDSYGDGRANQWAVAFMPIMTPAELAVVKTNLGQVLAEAPRNLTVYVSDRDKPGTSACDAACTKTWTPVRAPGAANATGDWSVVERSDGARQWAYKGRPLYRYAGDAKAGGTAGDGVDKVWHALVLEPPPPMPAWVRIHQSDAGELFTDATGKTLYQFVQVQGNARTRVRRNATPPAEVGGGAEQQAPPPSPRRAPEPAPPIFTPVTADATGTAKPVGNWRIITHDGREQWAYKGLPLFTNNFDTMPGDLKGSRGGDRRFHTIMRSGEQMQGTGQ